MNNLQTCLKRLGACQKGLEWAGRHDMRDFDTGEMLVTGASVTPEDCIGMLESYAIWLLKRRTKGRCLNVAD